MSESDPDKHPLQEKNRNGDGNVKKNISMLVVNVDEPKCHTAREILSRGGALNLTQKSNNFARGTPISVNCK